MSRKTPEGRYKESLIGKLETLFPGCEILFNDSASRQGIPDLLLLYGRYWALLEVKPSSDKPFRPNQEWYIEKFNRMGFSSVIHPQNEAEVLHALQQALSPF